MRKYLIAVIVLNLVLLANYSYCKKKKTKFAIAKSKLSIFRKNSYVKKKNLAYIQNAEKYLLDKYGKAFCKKLSGFFNFIEPDFFLLKLHYYDDKYERVRLWVWVVRKGEKYKVYEKLPSSICYSEVLERMGNTFLQYYFVEDKKLAYERYSWTNLARKEILKAKKQGKQLKINYRYKLGDQSEEKDSEGRGNIARVFFRYKNKKWQIVKVSLSFETPKSMAVFFGEVKYQKDPSPHVVSKKKIKSIIEKIKYNDKYSWNIEF